MIDFLKLFKEETFLTAAGSLFQSAGAAAANPLYIVFTLEDIGVNARGSMGERATGN